jgi:DNA repair ATPase RecN
LLESLTLWNFQVHEKIKIEFDPFVSTIIAPTDSGKSAIIRSMNWLCFNQSPSKSDNFINWNADKCKAKLMVDGRKIIREKGNGANKYSLDDKVFTAFGANVPDEVSNLLNLGEENFQFQHDPHFWFSKTSGQVSKELNRIVDLEAIDTSLSNVASMLRKAKSTAEVSEDRLKEAIKKKEELEWIVEAAEKWKIIEDRQNEIDTERSLINAQRQIIEEVDRLTKKREVLSESILELTKIVKNAEEIYKERQEINEKINLLNLVKDTEQKLSSLEDQITREKEILKKKTKDQNCPLCGNKM